MATQVATVVVLPTYDERENIEAIVPAVLAAVPTAHVWIVDDNSPDGTGKLADRLAAADSRVTVFHRPGKAGLGTAYVESFHRALSDGYDFVVEMDADFSHDPAILPDLLAAARSADLLLGSRYVAGGSTPDWTLPRRVISYVGNVVARYVLGIPVHDSTTGYRVFNRRALESLHLAGIRLQGYGFQIETVYQVHQTGLRIVEYPICFKDRRQGQSKMSRGIVIEALLYVFRRRFSQPGRNLAPNQPGRVADYHGPAKYADNGYDNVEPQAPAQAELPVDQLE
jgi:dolichol-phosphate mannosyltransferase